MQKLKTLTIQIFGPLIRLIARITRLPEQFVTFLFVGVLNTLVGYLFYAFFVFLGFNYIWAPFFATVCGVLFNFQTIGRIVFKNKDNSLIGKFFAVYAVVYVCNVLGLKGFEVAGLTNMYISGAILVLPLALLGYLLNKKFVFKGGSK